MKKLVCIALAVLFTLSLMLVGCTPSNGKSPADYKGVKWVTPDYSFRFDPENECKGNYNFNDKKYNIQVKFDGTKIYVNDTDSSKELFNGEWMYEDGEALYIHSIFFNTSDYEEFKNNYNEFYRLHQEKTASDGKDDSKTESKEESK